MSWLLLPVALTVAPKSSAMRAGLVIEKPIGSLAGGFLHRDVDDHVGALLVGADRFDRVVLRQHGALRQQPGLPAARPPGRALKESGHLWFSLLSCSSSFDMRSTQSPARPVRLPILTASRPRG
jgi:hypothetical protein